MDTALAAHRAGGPIWTTKFRLVLVFFNKNQPSEANKVLQNMWNWPKNEQAAQVRQHKRGSKANRSVSGDQHMPFEHEYGDSTPKIKTNFLTFDYLALRGDLEREGWRTPDCYSKTFDAAGDFSAVYLFMLVDRMEYKAARPAYVGMSMRLAQRWSGHPILTELDDVDAWVQRWFIRVPRSELRTVETANINRFDPPWNVIGRKRGVSAL
jgi:hypothetical protein